MKKFNCPLALVCVTLLQALTAYAQTGPTLEAAVPSWKIAYDTNGLVTRFTDPGGQTTRFNYSLDDRKRLRQLASEFADGGKVVLNYDDSGRCLQMTDTLGVVHYDHDRWNNLTGVRRDGQPEVHYGYDTQDRLTSISLGQSFTTGYSYDFLGRLAAIDTPAGKITYQYQTGQNKIIRTLPNGIWTSWEFGPDGKLTALSHVGKDNQVILQFNYAYRPDGLIQGIKEWSPQVQKTITYEYDNVQRLITVNDSSAGTTRYTYDSMGNRTQMVNPDGTTAKSEYDWAGRLLTQDGKACQHDSAGNLVAYTNPSGEQSCEYDAGNRLKSVSGAAGKVEYQYDGRGMLVGRIQSGQRETFLPDALADIWRPLAAMDSGGQQTFFVWEGDKPRMEIQGRDVKFFLEDHLGSIRCTVDGQGHVLQQSNYGVFGSPGADALIGGLGPGFAGLFYDPTAKLYLTKARAYDPELHRFLQMDPQQRISFGSQKDLDAYVYCGDDPVNFSDHDGAAPTLADMESQMWDQQFNLMEMAMQTRERQTEMQEQESEMIEQQREHIEEMNEQAQSVRPNEWAGTLQFRNGVMQDYVTSIAVTYERGVHTYATFAPELEWPEQVADIIAGKVSDYGNNHGINESLGSQRILGSWPWVGVGAAAINTAFSTLHANIQTEFTYVADQFTGLIQTGDKLAANQYSWIQSDVVQPVENIVSHELPAEFNVLKFNLSAPDHESIETFYGRLSGNATDILKDQFIDKMQDALQPSKLGGVSLLGAGDSLKFLGALQGVALDKNGQLILISKTGNQIGLPPLRLEDVVTVFRSVYEHGQSPFVSIDPNPADPRGPIMITRQAPATVDTYPQWVLFEADRVMKTFSSGADNVTRQPIHTEIPGYQSLIDLGFSNGRDDGKDMNWNRFWIVPARMERQQSSGRELSLFDVPLKVNAEHMVLKDGKLETAPDGTPSPEAKTFSDWFTTNYQNLCREIRSQPPVASGISGPVAIYTELERVALITGIAETLRDQGVPMPFWIRDFPVTPCPVPQTTPAITVQGQRTRQTAAAGNSTEIQQIYGGVDLSVPDADRHTVWPSERADQMLQSLPSMLSPDGLAEARAFDCDGGHYEAVALPGANTPALGACRMSETDLLVPVLQNLSISLVRNYNSFFKPSGIWGRGWTPDFPELDSCDWPVSNNGKDVSTQTVLSLSSPLNSYSETFNQIAFVPEVNGNLQVPLSTNSSMLGVEDAQLAQIGLQTKGVIFRDGREWYFDQDGRYVAIRRAPLLVVYRWSGGNQLKRIEGWLGTNLLADIQLESDSSGRIIQARGSDGQVVRYVYDQAGELSAVKHQRGAQNDELDYDYNNGFLAKISVNGKTSRELVCNERGQLVSESSDGGEPVTYQTSLAGQGVAISSVGHGNSASVEYDSSFRPLDAKSADGRTSHWRYQDDGGIRYTEDFPGGSQLSADVSADRQTVTGGLSGGPVYQANYDRAGRLTRLQQDGREMLHSEWNSDGQLASAANGSTRLQFSYNADGVPAQTLITPPGAGQNSGEFVEVDRDQFGRAATIRDNTGNETTIGYDQTGQPALWQSHQGGIQLKRDDSGRPKQLQTSWGDGRNWEYNSTNGALEKIEYVAGKEKASVRFEGGKPTEFRHFDGGSTKINYSNEGRSQGLPQQVLAPNGVKMEYNYNSANQLSAIRCGDSYKLRYDYDAEGRLTGITQMPLVAAVGR